MSISLVRLFFQIFFNFDFCKFIEVQRYFHFNFLIRKIFQIFSSVVKRITDLYRILLKKSFVI